MIFIATFAESFVMKAEIAIINSNVLEGLGLKHIIELLLPVAVVSNYETLQDVKHAISAEGKQFFHFFVAHDIVSENDSFFKNYLRQTIVLIKKDVKYDKNFLTIETDGTTDEIMTQLLKLLSKGHENFCHFPQEVAKVLKREDDPKTVKETSEPNVKLTKRELEVLRYVARGLASKNIADLMCISESTVITHRKHIMDKLHTHSATQVVAIAFQNGMINLNEW